MAEVLTDLAAATRNASWLALAARFERPCFVGPLALAYGAPPPPPGRKGAAAHALERMHGNTHLPQLLGAMARYEVTGDGVLRGAAEAFWAELGGHQFVTGGSTVNEVWKGRQTLGDVVSQHGATSFGAHDVHETCVTHNSMRVSRRLLSWGAPRPREGEAHLLRHAAYYERALLNAVLGTQRGTNPGQMLYMYPMGGGVAKSSRRSGSELHHWGDRGTHWCCQGSGIEAFARLADSIFWVADAAFHAASSAPRRDAARPPPPTPHMTPQLFVLQPGVAARLRWREQRCVVEVRADAPGARAADAPLQTALRVTRDEAHAGGEPTPPLVLWVRVPGWADGATAAASGGLRLAGEGPPARPVAADALLPVVYAGGGEGGQLSLRWSMRLRWERLADSREHFGMLQAALWGPLVLAALTRGDRTLAEDARLTPVPAAARRELVSLRLAAPRGSRTPAGAEGCLVTRWEHVWVVWRADRSRSFLTAPPKPCVARATPVADEIADWPQRDGGRGGGYQLDASQSDAACRTYEACRTGVPGTGDSPFASGALHAMHNGVGAPLVLSSEPPVVNGTRRGGTDAANAATWRVTPTPLGLHAGAADGAGGAGGQYLESFDAPGHVLSVAAASTEVALGRLRSPGAAQRWHLVPVTAGDAATAAPMPGGAERRVTLQSADRPGMALRVAPRPHNATGEAPPPLLHLGAFASRTAQLQLGAAADASEFVVGEGPAEYPPLALWAAPPAGAAGSGGAERRRETYLMIPLNEVVDEHYSVYLCRLAARVARPPPFCSE